MTTEAPTAPSFGRVLTIPGAPVMFSFAVIGRLSYGMIPIGMVLAVAKGSGSFAVAGASVALFGVASLTMPLKSRALDRMGLRIPLITMALATAATWTFLGMVAIRADDGNALLMMVLGLTSGICAPPLGPAMRVAWRYLTASEPRMTERAYMLDSVVEETLYLIGPLTVGVLLAVAHPSVVLWVCSGLLLLGTVGMVLPPRVRRMRSQQPTRTPAKPVLRIGPIRDPRLMAISVAMLVTAIGLSNVYTAVAGHAARLGRPEIAGYVGATMSLVSLLGGIVWTRRRARTNYVYAMAGFLGWLAAWVGLAALWADRTFVSLALLAISAAVVAPWFTVAYLAADSASNEDEKTEAMTWVNTSNNLGSAAGSALGGVILNAFSGSGVAYAASALLYLVGALAMSGLAFARGGSWLGVASR